MADFDTLTLGPFTFTGMAPPDQMPLGGIQQVVVHRLPGGSRTVDVMGPDDHDPEWSGTLWGDSAFSDMLTLDAMRKAGQELAFSWGAEARTVVIAEFHAKVEKQACVHYSIKLIYTDDGTAQDTGIGVTLDSMIASDLTTALSM